MSCPLPHCPGRHAPQHDSARQFPAVRITDAPARDAGTPPIFREVMAALTNRPRRPTDLFDADLEGAASHSLGGNGGVWPGKPWRRLLNTK